MPDCTYADPRCATTDECWCGAEPRPKGTKYRPIPRENIFPPIEERFLDRLLAQARPPLDADDFYTDPIDDMFDTDTDDESDTDESDEQDP